MLHHLAAAAIAAASLLAAPARAQGLDLELVASGLAEPVFVGSPPEDHTRLFVLERPGRVRIVEEGALRDTPFLDLTGEVSFVAEHGLLGIAFHPDYPANGRFFVSYVDTGGTSRVVEYRVSGDPDRADETPVATLLTQIQPSGVHDAGCIHFGADGMLYVAIGDGGSWVEAQDPTNLLGKIMRLDVDLGPPWIPADNPLVGKPGARGEIWALGLRNPWRFSFDRATGDLWIADVGWLSWEEVDFQPAASAGGENYGWNCFEGPACTGECDCAALSPVPPVFAYAHDIGCAVIGGHVYRGAAMPALSGTYFFADYCTSRIWTLRDSGEEQLEFRDRGAELPGLDHVVAFGEDAAGELYVCERLRGRVHRIVPDAGTSPFCEALPNSTGARCRMASSGSTSIAKNDFTLQASGGVPAELGLFFYAGAPLQLPFGDGFLCVAPAGTGYFRLVPPLLADEAGGSSRRVDFDERPAGAGAGRIQPGSTWCFQYWYRDLAGAGSGFNLSDGLAARFRP